MKAAELVIDFEGARGARKVSAFELARFCAGELSSERRKEIEALLASDDALRAELDELRARDLAFRVQMPFERFRADHEARAGAGGGIFARLLSLRWSVGGAVVAAAAAALAIAVFVPGSEAPYYGTKGAAGIGFFVKSAEGARWGADGERLHEGDRIQFAVKDAAGRRAMVIVGVDGRGQVSTYVARKLPTGIAKGDEGPAEPRLLEQSLVLDDALGAERFFVLFGDVDVDELARVAEEAARALASSGADLSRVERLPLAAADIEQSSVHIVKVPE